MQRYAAIVSVVAPLCFVQPAAAAEISTMIAAQVDAPSADGTVRVDLLFANEAREAASVAAPERLDAELRVAGRIVSATLERETAVAAAVEVAPGDFRRVSYRLVVPSGLKPGALAALTIPGMRTNSAAVIIPANASVALAEVLPAPAASLPQLEPTPAAAPQQGDGNGFLPGLSAYDPIYAVAGAGTNTNVKLQLSFRYQLFGDQGVFGGSRSWLDGLHFAYTQRMYWDTQRSSLPFRNIDFQPELIYVLQSRPRENAPRYGVQVGLRHESNGREGDASRSVNIAYVQPRLTAQVGAYDVTIGPRAWFYYGGQAGNENIERYRGYTGLALEVGQDDGLRLTSFTRYNLDSGKGAAQLDASYPLNRLIWSKLNLYLYGQLFTGYGENLLDYDRRSTRARFGVAIVR
jgi:outer membrane phospholipase A